MENYTDNEGTKIIDGAFTLLVEPSEEYMLKQETERIEQEKLNSLIPSTQEIEKAETEIQVITILREVGVI